MQRPYNFSAGPAAMPAEVLAQAADEMLDWPDASGQRCGMGVMEMSHRGKEFQSIYEAAEASLRELVAAAPAPWAHILDEHRQAFLVATEEINGMAASNRELIARGQRDVHDALAWLGEERETTYAPDGSAASRATAARLFDGSL